jgi:hypothetical protein
MTSGSTASVNGRRKSMGFSAAVGRRRGWQ